MRFSACLGALGTCRVGPSSPIRLSTHIRTTSVLGVCAPQLSAVFTCHSQAQEPGEGGDRRCLSDHPPCAAEWRGDGSSTGEELVIDQEAARHPSPKQVPPMAHAGTCGLARLQHCLGRAARVQPDPHSHTVTVLETGPVRSAGMPDYFWQPRRITAESQRGGQSLLPQEATAALPPSELSHCL